MSSGGKWVYSAEDRERPCKVCGKVWPIKMFPTNLGSGPNGPYPYHSRTCTVCKPQPRPRNWRKNDRGDWYCSRCETWKDVTHFRWLKSRNRTYAWCRECYRAWQRVNYQMKSQDEEWFNHFSNTVRKAYKKRHKRAAEERSELAHLAVTWLLNNGWGVVELMKELKLSHRALVRARNGEPLRVHSVSERLVDLWQKESARLERLAA